MFENILENKYEMSLGKIILLYFLLASSSSLFPILSKQWKTTLESSRLAQHLLGITTMLAIIILVSNGNFSIQRIITYTVIGYLVFILSTKLDLQWNIMIILGLLGFFMYQDNNLTKDNNLENDKNVSEQEKESIQKNNKSSYVYITLAIIGAVICGNLLYSDKKETQYGGGYSLTKFLFE